MELLNKERIESINLQYDTHPPLELPDGGYLYIEQYGTGNNLTIVNNFFLIAPLWKNFTSELKGRQRIVAYDLRNQGGSSVVEGEMPFDVLVDDLVVLLDHLGIEQTYLLGSSTSTLICRDFTLKYPDRVKGLILISPLFCPYGTRRRKALTRSWLNSLEKGGANMLFDHIYPLVYSDRTIENGGTPAYLALRQRFLALNSTEQLRIFLNASLTTDDDPRKLREIVCPTLLVAGETDFLMCRSSLEAAATLIGDAEVKVIPYAGHVPYFESTRAFEMIVQSFIDSVEQRNQLV